LARPVSSPAALGGARLGSMDMRHGQNRRLRAGD
jgi:hypothetical protein